MRPIKFRAWDTTEKRMKEIHEIFFDQHGYLDIYSPCNSDNPMSAELMQFTGLLDKQGKEIYEGDLLKLDTGFIAEVAFEYGEFFVRPHIKLPENRNKGETASLRYVRGMSEIIGNIYEHPELLKERV